MGVGLILTPNRLLISHHIPLSHNYRLMNTTIEKGSKNALEALLYPPRLPRNVNIDTPTKSKTKQHLADNYENGMLISISNNKTYWED